MGEPVNVRGNSVNACAYDVYLKRLKSLILDFGLFLVAGLLASRNGSRHLPEEIGDE
jgi:hypothetical protein